MSSLWSLVNGRVCGNCWQTALQPCLIISLPVCSRVATLVMVQFECLSTCVQCSYCTCLILCGDAPNCMWTGVAMPTLAGVNCAKHGEESIYSNSNYRGLDEEEEQLIVQDYGNVTSSYFHTIYWQLLSLLYSTHGSCDTKTFVLSTVWKINIHFDSLSCWLVYSVVTVYLSD